MSNQIPTPSEVQDHVERLCVSAMFMRSERVKALLRHVVGKVLNNETDQLKDLLIGADLYKKPSDWNPENDSTVRVAFSELRRRLADYYKKHGNDPIRITIPKPGCVPHFAYGEYEPYVPLLNRIARRHVGEARVAINLRTLHGYDRALHHLDLALKEHHDHPQVLSLKAYTHFDRATHSAAPHLDICAAQELIGKVRSLVSNLPWECVFTQACLHQVHYDLPWHQIKELYSLAIAKSNGCARYESFYVAFLVSMRHFDEAIEIQSEIVDNRSPNNPSAHADLGLYLTFAGKHAEARDFLQDSLDVFGMGDHAYVMLLSLAIAYDAMGDIDRAYKAIEQIPLNPLTYGFPAYLKGRARNPLAAYEEFDRLRTVKTASPHSMSAGQVALAAIGAGLQDEAVKYLNDAVLVENDPQSLWLHLFPMFSSLHSHPGFRNLVIDQLRLPLDP